MTSMPCTRTPLVLLILAACCAIPVIMGKSWETELSPFHVTYFGQMFQGYYFSIGIGTPAQQFNVQLDTGSTVLWVTSSACKEPICQHGRRFNASQSSTWMNNGTEISVDYGGPKGKGLIQITGDVAVDVVHYTSSIAIKRQFLPVYYVHAPFSELPIDGIAGFAFPKEEYPELLTWLPLAEMGILNPVVFSVWMPPTLQGNGKLLMGSTDNEETYHNGPIVYVDVLMDNYTGVPIYGHWLALIDDILVNGESLGYCSEGNCTALFDTGGGNLQVGPVLAMTRPAPDCSNLPYLPTVGIKIAGVVWTLTPEDYTFILGPGKCSPGIATLMKGTYISLGYTWMRKFFTVFDPENKKIGIAYANQNPLTL